MSPNCCAATITPIGRGVHSGLIKQRREATSLATWHFVVRPLWPNPNTLCITPWKIGGKVDERETRKTPSQEVSPKSILGPHWMGWQNIRPRRGATHLQGFEEAMEQIMINFCRRSVSVDSHAAHPQGPAVGRCRLLLWSAGFAKPTRRQTFWRSDESA